MALNNKTLTMPSKSILLGFSLFTGFLVFFILFSRINQIKNMLQDETNIFTLFIVTGFFVFVLFSLIGVNIINKIRHKVYIAELENFKNFTDALNHTDTEIDIYKTLFNYMHKIPYVTYVNIFYREDGFKRDSLWKIISDDTFPICDLNAFSCPVFLKGENAYVKSISKGTVCPHQLPYYQNGSYLCILLLNENSSKSLLQLYSEKENAFTGLTRSRIISYTEIAKAFISGKRSVTKLTKVASIDKLTKLYNRGYIELYLSKQLEYARTYNQPLSVLMLDIDHFKKVNDTYGHSAGDQVLIIFAELISNCLRRSDVAGRYGGEEFIVVLPATDVKIAYIIAERIRLKIQETSIPPIGGIKMPSITCSVGVSTFPYFADTVEALKKTSDLALYSAKESGRNQSKVYDEDIMGKA